MGASSTPTARDARTESPLDEDFELGAFTAEPGKKGFTAASVLHVEKRLARW